MTNDAPATASDHVDVGAYCRQIEDHLARVNNGHLVRVVGPGFELARQWALAGIPLSLVFYGISQKAERHQAGRSKRPLRLEFCEADVQAAYEHWRRAVGLFEQSSVPGSEDDALPAEPRRKSLTKHLERAVERLGRVAGRLDLPDPFRVAVGELLSELATALDEARRTRGSSREPLLVNLAALDARLLAGARDAVGGDELGRLRTEAAGELLAYRSRLDPAAWERSVGLGVDRLLRDKLGLPAIIP